MMTGGASLENDVPRCVSARHPSQEEAALKAAHAVLAKKGQSCKRSADQMLPVFDGEKWAFPSDCPEQIFFGSGESGNGGRRGRLSPAAEAVKSLPLLNNNRQQSILLSPETGREGGLGATMRRPAPLDRKGFRV